MTGVIYIYMDRFTHRHARRQGRGAVDGVGELAPLAK